MKPHFRGIHAFLKYKRFWAVSSDRERMGRHVLASKNKKKVLFLARKNEDAEATDPQLPREEPGQELQ